MNKIYYIVSIELVEDDSIGVMKYEAFYTNGIKSQVKYYDCFELSHIPTQIIEE